MSSPRHGGFIEGLLFGAAGTLLLGTSLVYVLDFGNVVEIAATRAPGLQQVLDWAQDNLGLSLPVFAVIAFLFLHSLLTLRRRIGAGESVERVAQAEHLAEIWSSLFFGVGVIWTAIGMRGALLFALGDPLEVQQDGAFAILQRMVDGGILLALSTTIFGGVGGYLMRVVKTLAVGTSLKRYYQQAARAQGTRIHTTLESIDTRLHGLQRQEATGQHTGATEHERPALV